MYTPKFTAKRVLGLVLATALAVSGTVALASSSEAAVTALKLSPSTGGPGAGNIVTITGKGFATAGGTSKVSKVWFSVAACDIANLATNAATLVQAISSTKVVATAPALTITASPTPTVYNLCLSNTGDAAVIGTAKYTVYAVPTINTGATGANVGVSPVKGSVNGGGIIVIRGENFTAKSTATVGGVALTKVKVEVGSSTTASATAGDDTLTGTLPALTAGSGKAVVVTSEGGKSANAASTFTAENTVKVSPSGSDGTLGNGITVTGSGFLALAANFSATLAATNAQVVLVRGLPTSPVITANVLDCGNVQVESDTQLSCTLTAAVADGAYTVLVIVDASGTTLTSTTAMSASATYTVSDY